MQDVQVVKVQSAADLNSTNSKNYDIMYHPTTL